RSSPNRRVSRPRVQVLLPAAEAFLPFRHPLVGHLHPLLVWRRPRTGRRHRPAAASPRRAAGDRRYGVLVGAFPVVLPLLHPCRRAVFGLLVLVQAAPLAALVDRRI